MGGQNSRTLFKYECNNYVAEFIQFRPHYLDELTRQVQAFAVIRSFEFSSFPGILTLQAVQNASSSNKDTCKQILDHYFNQFLSFEETLEKVISKATLDSILNSPGLRCTAVRNRMNNSIRITGKRSDVNKMIDLLRSAQTPHVTESKSLSSTTSAVHNTTPNFSITSSSFNDTTRCLAINATVLDTTKPNVLSPATPDVLSPTTQLCKNTCDNDDDSNNVRQLQNLRQEADRAVPMSSDSSISQKIPLSTLHLFRLQAQDFPVARFIKYSDEHTSKLKQALTCLAQSVSIIVFSSKDIQYELKPKRNLMLTEEEFDEMCKEQLLNFLQNYSSRRTAFSKDQLQRVKDAHPKFFLQKSNKDNGGVFIRWHYDDCVMIMAGLKFHVEQKEKEIVKFFNDTAPRYVFKYLSQELCVARFINSSSIHKANLEKSLKEVATIKIFVNNVKRLAEYHCCLLPGVDLVESDFEAMCETIVQNFLKQYISTLIRFDRDQLTKVSQKHPDFFKKQTSRKNQEIFVEWQLGKSRVRVAGVKKEVDSKVKEIVKFVETAEPKSVSSRYVFKLTAPDHSVARFIKQSVHHLGLLETSLAHLGTVEICISALEGEDQDKIVEYCCRPLTGLDLSGAEFDQSCRSAFMRFLDRYSSLEKSFNQDHLKKVILIEKEFFKSQTPDESQKLFVEWQVANYRVRIAGVKEDVNAKIQEIIQFLENVLPKKSDLQPYIYQPRKNANKWLIKHIFLSALELKKLYETLGRFIIVEVYPDAENPQSMKLFPKPDIDVHYYFNRVPVKLEKFLSKYLVSQKKCLPHEEKQVIEKVYQIVEKQKFPEKSISIYRKNDDLYIVGPNFVIQRITYAINGSNCFEDPINIRLAPNSKKEKAEKRDEPSASRKSSQISPQKTFVYEPPNPSISMFLFACNNPRFREELESRFDDFCTICATGESLKVKPKDSQKVDLQFTKKLINEMERFLNSIKFSNICLDDDVIKYLQENKNNWLQSFYDPSDWAEICVLEKSIAVKGFNDNVDKYVALIHEQLEVITSATKDFSENCRILSFCGVIAETNRQLGGIVTISCSVDEGLIFYEGRRMFLSYAMAKFAEVNHLYEEPPLISDEKQKALKIFLTNRQQNDNKEFVQKKLTEKKSKCVLLLRSDKLILAAMTMEIHQKGSKYIDDLLLVTNISMPNASDRNSFNQNNWKDLENDIQDSSSIFVKIQDTSVRLIGLDKSQLQVAYNKINAFIMEKMRYTQPVTCEDLVRRFILKYCVPDNLEISKTSQGLSVNGSKTNVDKYVKTLEKFALHHSQQTFTAPNLISYFSSSSWKDFVKILEHDIRCIVDYNSTKSASQFEEEDEKAAASGTLDPFRFPTVPAKKTAYGCVTVSVRYGDIAAERSDVIVNGVIDRNFNLSLGAVSKALLRRAGPKMQEECDRADKASPMLRSTKGWGLLCSRVIHIVTPREAEKLTDRVKEALDHAELLKAKSVAIPTIGAGGIGLAANDVASALSQAVELFALRKPRYVRHIKIVVFEKSLVDSFRNSIIQAKETMGFCERAVELAEAKAKSLKDDEVVVFINTDDLDCLNKAKSKIVDSMSKVIIKKTFKEENLSKLQDNDRFDIFRAAVKHNAFVTFNFTSSEIVLKGLAENVAKLYDAIREILFELKEAITMSKIANWKWASASNIYSSLPLRVSRAIENEYEKSKTGNPRISMCGSDMWIDFSQETFSFGLISGKIVRGDQDAMSSYPPEWVDMTGKAMIKVSLDCHSSEYIKVLNLFQASRPYYSELLRIERIQNPTLYSQYQIYKRDVERNMTSHHRVERELFHGTDRNGIENILRGGFDRNFAGKNAAVFGKGCYFAVNSKYSVDYVDQKSPTKYMILARVVTGDFCKGSSDMKAPPENPLSKDAAQRYHSTVNNDFDPSIFVVFKDSGVYPSYLISFN